MSARQIRSQKAILLVLGALAVALGCIAGSAPGRHDIGWLYVGGAVLALIVVLARELLREFAAAGSSADPDRVTGRLAGATAFARELDQRLPTLAEGCKVAVVLVELEGLKRRLDSLAAERRAELLEEIATRLAGPDPDVLAQLDDQCFAFLRVLPNGAEPGAGGAEALARSILAAFAKPLSAGGREVSLSPAVGVVCGPDHGREAAALLPLAHAALAAAKERTKTRVCVFAGAFAQAYETRRAVEEDLRRAIAEDGLELHYQPLYSPDGKTPLGVEALVRWNHPRLGYIGPAEFIPIAEEHGLVIPLGEWVLRRACRDARRWPSLRVAVNVSAIQFRQADFVETVQRCLAEAELDPSRLELELTETVVVGDADAAEAAMIELRALGVHLALDDFGTGYSSLIYLRRFAFDKIKIDKSFLDSLEGVGESAILVHSMVHLGRALGLTVTAEGVETREQQRYLHALGCHQLQGFLFSKPVPAEQIDALVAPPPRERRSGTG